MLHRWARSVGLLAVAAAWFSCGGGYSTAYQQGRKAEERKDWDTALVDYKKAKESDPANPLYILHEQNARSHASLTHLENGRRLEEAGRLEEAAGELQMAARIDPSNQAAAQTLERLLARQTQAKEAHTEAIQNALKARIEATQPAAVKLHPLPQEPLAHFRLSADSRRTFETLGKLANLNVLFTADFRPVQISVDLSDVKLEDALRMVADETKSFWKVESPNTILIIPDNANNRRDYDSEVIKTIYLSTPLAASDRTAITTALKQVLGLQRIMDNPDANAIVIRDTPQKVAAAEQLVRELDRGKAEIMIDIDIVEADRDRIRDLGLAPVSYNSSGTLTQGITAGAVFSPTETVSGTTTSVTSIPFNTLGLADYAISLPGAAAEAVLNDNKTHILQNPQVRVTDGETAKLKIGSKVPYATGSFLPSLTSTTTSSSSTSLLASTQFQYQEIGVILELTPHLLPSGEVAVHAKIEISSVGASETIAGISEPTFGERVIEDEFRLQEGEVSLLGGLIQKTLTDQIEGLPGLGEIPGLRYLFSQDAKEVNDEEILVMLTPRVIRLPDAPISDSVDAPLGAAGGGESTPADVESPRPFEIPQAPPQQH